MQFSRDPDRTRPATQNTFQVRRITSSEPACEVPDGSASIERWAGMVLLPAVTVDQVLDSLRHELPIQEDIQAARFLEQSDDRVSVALRLVRRRIVTVVLDTEHVTTFDRRSDRLAISRSVMTRSSEIDSPDTPRERSKSPDEERGYLWRLNAYTRYAAHGNGVLVEMETAALGRSVPSLVRVMVAPIVESVGRESMTRTLEGLQRRFDRRSAR